LAAALSPFFAVSCAIAGSATSTAAATTNPAAVLPIDCLLLASRFLPNAAAAATCGGTTARGGAEVFSKPGATAQRPERESLDSVKSLVFSLDRRRREASGQPTNSYNFVGLNA